MSKLKLRRERYFYQDPPTPETGAYKFRVEMIKSMADRIDHWPRQNDLDESFYEYEVDEPEEAPEYSGKLRQSLSLKDINELVKKYGLDETEVFLTASLHEDYLQIEAVHVIEQSQEEQLEEYKNQVDKLAKRKNLEQKQKLKNITFQIESLQKQAENLKNSDTTNKEE